MKCLLFLISFNCLAGFEGLEQSYEYSFNKRSSFIRKKIYRRSKKSNIDNILKSIEMSDRSITDLLHKNEKRVIVRKIENNLKSLTRLKGILLNSVIATNRKVTTLIIKLKENEYFDEAEVRCSGISFGKRVIGKCNLVVSEDQEYQIDAELWDMDGAEGIIADQFYSGEEKEFLTSSFASFFEGVLGATKDRLITPYGEVDRKSGKNQVLSGLMGIAGNVSSKIKESGDKNLQIALINSGKEVYVFFQKKVKL